MSSAADITTPARWWLLPAVVLGALLAVTPVFWLTDLDLQVARWFLDADAGVLHDRWYWKAAYKLPHVLVPAWILAGLVLLLVAWRKPLQRHLWRFGLFLLLAIALGPGLVVNAVLKDHWGRPRPVQTVALGGEHPYAPPWQKGPSGRGKSFPSGHVSVPALFLGLALVLRRRRWAGFLWAGALAATAWVGCVRMLAGGHYLSDVLWSAGLVFLVSAGLQRLLRPRFERVSAGSAVAVP
jgi:membrane-associated phospholipid phosphatase